MEAPDGARLGVALIALAEIRISIKGEAAQEFTPPEVFRKIAAIIPKACKTDYCDFRNGQSLDSHDFHRHPHLVVTKDFSKIPPITASLFLACYRTLGCPAILSTARLDVEILFIF